MTTIPNPFHPDLFRFLEELAANNRRDWFEANRERYEDDVKEPALAFISAFGPELRAISRHFLAIPTATRGSLFRIYRDTRFSPDKRPYKTQVGIHFRHADGRDAHVPGFYLHLEPGNCFAGAGIWHPDSTALRRIRDALVARPRAWRAARDDAAFRDHFELAGDSLKTAPRGYDRDHPLIEDLRRTDFIGVAPFTRSEVLAGDFPARYTSACRAAAPFVRFLCTALDVPF